MYVPINIQVHPWSNEQLTDIYSTAIDYSKDASPNFIIPHMRLYVSAQSCVAEEPLRSHAILLREEAIERGGRDEGAVF